MRPIAPWQDCWLQRSVPGTETTQGPVAKSNPKKLYTFLRQPAKPTQKWTMSSSTAPGSCRASQFNRNPPSSKIICWWCQPMRANLSVLYVLIHGGFQWRSASSRCAPPRTHTECVCPRPCVYVRACSHNRDLSIIYVRLDRFVPKAPAVMSMWNMFSTLDHSHKPEAWLHNFTVRVCYIIAIRTCMFS